MPREELIKVLKGGLLLFKKRGLFILPLALLLYLTLFFLSPQILFHLEKKFQQNFVFFTIGEPILSLLRFSLTLFIILVFPLLYLGLLSLVDEILRLKRAFFLLFYFLGTLLFYTGVLFAYFITLPYGIKFLISFKTPSLEASLSLSHFVNFTSFFLLSFGLIFELPLILVLLTLLRLLQPEKVTRYRKEIFFFIVVFSAIITPTPDAINMSLVALPLYILFELGLWLGRMVSRFNIRGVELQRGPQQEPQPYQEA